MAFPPLDELHWLEVDQGSFWSLVPHSYTDWSKADVARVVLAPDSSYLVRVFDNCLAATDFRSSVKLGWFATAEEGKLAAMVYIAERNEAHNVEQQERSNGQG